MDIAALCRLHTVDCVNALVKAMKRERDAVQAATALLDRGWGRPKQQLEVSADADAIGLHLTAARALVAAFDAGTEAAQPPTIEHRPDSEPTTNALDVPKPVE